jgi:hypothetical protein
MKDSLLQQYTIDREQPSTASESTRMRIVRKNGLIKIIDKHLEKSNKLALHRTARAFQSQSLEQRILAGSFHATSSARKHQKSSFSVL